MGSPLGPILANIFLSYHEKIWLQNCPQEFKPASYHRFVDDTFLLFKQPQDIQKFLNYLNQQHPNMRFTSETEQDASIPFLGTTITRTAKGFETSVYRKPTFTGLYSDYNSFTPAMYKIGLIKILLHRAYSICSTYQSFHNELQRIKSILTGNGYSLRLIDSAISKFLNKQYAPKRPNDNPPEETIFISIPFIGPRSLLTCRYLKRCINSAFPKIHLKFAFATIERIGTRFQIKDRLPKCLASNIVYHFQCSSCNAAYVGQTQRHFNVRCSEHLGISARTGNRLQSLTADKSSILDHLLSTQHHGSHDNFKIIDSAKTAHELRIKEALHIMRLRPNLNRQQDTDYLLIFK